MFKALKWFMITLVALIVIGIVALYIFIRNFDINRYKDRITSAITEAVHRPVDIGHIQLELSLEKGLNLRVDKFSLFDEPPSQEAMISVESVYLGVDIRAFVFLNELVISNIELRRPFVKFVQYAEGANNLSDLAAAAAQAQATSPAPAASAPAAPKKEASVAAFDPNKLSIKRINVVDGIFSFNDTTVEPPLKIDIKDIDLLVQDFSLVRSFDFELSFNVFSNKENVFMKGQAAIDPVAQSVKLSDMTVKSALSDIDLKQVQAQFPALEMAGIEGALKGDVRADLRRLMLSAKGLDDYDFEGWLTDAQVKLKALGFPIENIDIHVLGRAPQLTVKDLFMYVGSGKITAQAVIDQFLTANKIKGNLLIEDLRLEEIIPAQAMEYTLVGKLQGSEEFSLEYNGSDDYLKTLSMDSKLQIKEGKIVDFNVLRTVLDKLSIIPSLAEGFKQRLPEKYKEKLNQRDTIIEAVEISTKVQADQIFLENVLVKAEGFEVNARGKMDLAQNLYLELDFYLPADLATPMLSSSADLTFLLQEDGRLRIPIKAYRGPLAKFKVYPDMDYITKEAIQQKGKQELKKAIFKALDIEEAQPAPTQPAPAPSQPPSQEAPQDVPPERILIENVLDAIFK